MKNTFFIISFLLLSVITYAQSGTDIKPSELPAALSKSVEKIFIDNMGDVACKKEIKRIDKNTVHIKISFELTKDVQQDDWQISIKPKFRPTYHWAPHLSPENKNVIDQHVFRAPVLIAMDDKQVLYVMPDVEILGRGSPVRWYMDMDAINNKLSLGMTRSKVGEHVLFDRLPGAIYPKGKIEYGFYLMSYSDKETIENPFRIPLAFYWKHHGRPLYEGGQPLSGNLRPYVQHTYNWAFNTWKKNVWQEFQIDGKTVGAPVFIVNVTQSPNYPGEVNEREFRSIWNQAWFSSLRSASGLYRYAKKNGDNNLLEKANLTKELALSFPKKSGFFYGLVGTDMHEVEIDGKKYHRSKGWDHRYWGNSNRNPYEWDAAKAPFHILDMSWTSLLMLRWYDELEADPRLLEYAEGYAKALLEKQTPDGFFPGWLDLKTLEPMQHLNQSPETSMSVTFLLKLYEITKTEIYKTAAIRAMQAVMHTIIPVGQWEDFETYWSCSRYGGQWIGQKVERNNMFKQCNFSMFWTTEALFECYKITQDKKYLKAGQRTLDELLMTQSVWQPPYIYVKAFGGFGVMNMDGEWADSRESLFAEIIMQYGKLLNMPEYTERGIAALKSAFVMMYCPENPVTKMQWEKVWPFFGKEDYGFTMENYGHTGHTSPEGEGMGEFTIYDWGNGAAAEAYNRIIDKFGENYIK
jgi:hypothetical protein